MEDNRGSRACGRAVEETKVLLADDHEIFRDGLKSLLNAHAGIRVVGEARDGAEAVALARRLKPDVVIMDVSMPALDGIDAAERVKARQPDICIIGLSMFDDEVTKERMREAGADHYLSKGGAGRELIDLLRRPAAAP